MRLSIRPHKVIVPPVISDMCGGLAIILCFALAMFVLIAALAGLSPKQSMRANVGLADTSWMGR